MTTYDTWALASPPDYGDSEPFATMAVLDHPDADAPMYVLFAFDEPTATAPLLRDGEEPRHDGEQETEPTPEQARRAETLCPPGWTVKGFFDLYRD